MFCPECGTENARNQKFCTRCGTSLLAIEYARSIVSDMATGKSNNSVDTAQVLRITAWISVAGLLLITMGTIFLSLIFNDSHQPPVGLFFGVAGLIALVLIVRRLLKLIDRSDAAPAKVMALPSQLVSHVTNRNLTEGTQPHYSVTEERTRQLENQR